MRRWLPAAPRACSLPDPCNGSACASIVPDALTPGALLIPGIFGPFLLTPATPLCGAAGFSPFADGTRDTPAYGPIPLGLSGYAVYGAVASLCLTPAAGASPLTAVSNTIRMIFQ